MSDRMPSSRDPLGRFYTQPAIGDLLVTLMGETPPQRILDLGAGSGALSRAARLRWTNSDITTVDVDEAISRGPLSAIGLSGPGLHRHVVADVLDADLPDRLGEVAGGFDAALCNPPYIVPRWQPSFERILEEAGLDGLFHVKQEPTAEALFIAQNLRLTRDGAQIGLIVPDGLVTGRRFRSFRRAILHNHTVQGVVQLPRGSFRRTDAQAFILVLAKGVPSIDGITLHRMEPEGALSEPVCITRERAEERLDWGHHVLFQQPSEHGPTLSDLGADVRRGSLETKQARASDLPMFHTTDFPAQNDTGGLDLPDADSGRFGTLIVAEPGDILIARVDRRLHRKVAQVRSGRAALTSCVYRVRVAAEMCQPVFASLTSPQGCDRLASTARGVGPRMLGKEDLLRMPLSLPDAAFR
ncbi:N-6 DNA methylase [Methylobacterium sp. WL122]|nr:N-6 DNA methylase [Methylobacterium sp. WL122]